MKKIVFLVSGSGGTLRFLYYAIKRLELDIEITGVISDRECTALDFAVQNKIYSKKIKYDRTSPGDLRSELETLQPGLIVTNIHKIIDTGTLKIFPEKFINLHYSLLPSFGGIIGMETVERAKKLNTGFIGGTCHEVCEEVDAGRIIQQGCFAVDWDRDKDIVDTVFKVSCIVLLGGIMTKFVLSSGTKEQLILNNRKANFSPALPFDDVFDDALWELIREIN